MESQVIQKYILFKTSYISVCSKTFLRLIYVLIYINGCSFYIWSLTSDGLYIYIYIIYIMYVYILYIYINVYISSAPGVLNTVERSVVLYSLTRATLMSPVKDETSVCLYIYIHIYINIYIYIHIHIYIYIYTYI